MENNGDYPKTIPELKKLITKLDVSLFKVGLKRDQLQKSHDNLYKSLKDLVFCIRDFQMRDYSPLMDEIFDAEHDLKIGKKYYKNENK